MWIAADFHGAGDGSVLRHQQYPDSTSVLIGLAPAGSTDHEVRYTVSVEVAHSRQSFAEPGVLFHALRETIPVVESPHEVLGDSLLIKQDNPGSTLIAIGDAGPR